VDRVKQQPIVLGSREAGNLRVRVVDNEMADAQGVACRVRSHESGVSVATLSGVEVGLPEGTYSVTLEGSWIGKGAAGVSANLVGGDRAEAVLDLGGRKSVTLRIRAADVPTLGRVQLKWVMEGAASPLWTYNWNPHSDSLVWLPKGQHVLEVHCPGYKPSMVKIGLDDADHQRVLNISMAPDVK
jgi:hypothetical protein